MKVIIQRSFKASKESEIDVKLISRTCWDDISGGIRERHAGYSLYGYIPYELAAILVDCSGIHERLGNEAKIMIPANSNRKMPYHDGYELLKTLAGPKPEYRKPGQKPCTKRILELLDVGAMERKHLREVLIEEQYPANQIARALKRMFKDGRLILHGSANSPKQLIERT